MYGMITISDEDKLLCRFNLVYSTLEFGSEELKKKKRSILKQYPYPTVATDNVSLVLQSKNMALIPS